MNARGIAADVGTAASIIVLVLVALPYAVVDAGTIAVYYSSGILGPQYFGIAAAVTSIAFRAARTRRSDPATVAGTTLAIGAVMALLAIIWALSVSPSVVGGISSAAWFEYHRWVTALTALLVPAAAGVYANSVLE